MTCDEVKKQFNLKVSCCESCHEDKGMCSVMIEGQNHEVCCAVTKAYNELQPWEKRKQR